MDLDRMMVLMIESAENEGYTPKFLQNAFPEFTTDCWSSAKWLKRDFPEIYEKTSYLKTYVEGY